MEFSLFLVTFSFFVFNLSKFFFCFEKGVGDLVELGTSKNLRAILLVNTTAYFSRNEMLVFLHWKFKIKIPSLLFLLSSSLTKLRINLSSGMFYSLAKLYGKIYLQPSYLIRIFTDNRQNCSWVAFVFAIVFYIFPQIAPLPTFLNNRFHWK